LAYTIRSLKIPRFLQPIRRGTDSRSHCYSEETVHGFSGL
jgi:hypothetical protein